MIHVTEHAIDRYRERVEAVSADAARIALSSEAIVTAANFGAPYVKLGTGQRVVLEGSRVITVLPHDMTIGRMAHYARLHAGPGIGGAVE
jgi:uncharacterized protein (DUF2252 family)